MADDKIIAPPPGLVLTETHEEPQTPPMPANISEPPGLVRQGVTPGLRELQRRQGVAIELEKATEALPDPQEEQAGIQNTYFYSHALGIPRAEAYQLRNEIAKELTDDSTKQKTFWNRLTETVKTGAKSGHSGLQAGLIQEKVYEEAFQLSLEALAGNWNQERYNGILELQQQIHSLAPSEDTNFLNQVLWDVGQILPNMIGAMGEGGLYGLGTGAIGAVTGTVVPGLGTASAGISSFLVGFGAGMASHSFRQMRGQSWLILSQMRDEEGNPIPQFIVQLVSFAAGALKAAIEVGQMGTLIKTVPAARKILEKSVGNAFDEVIKNGTLRSKILQRMGEYGKYWTIEVGEELLQEIVDIVSEHVSKDLSNAIAPQNIRGVRGVRRRIEAREGTQFEYSTIIEDYKRLVDTFVHSGPALAILGLPGNVVGGVQDIAAWQQQQEQEVEARAGLSPEEDELLRVVSEGLRVETTTPEVAEISLSQRLVRASKERMIPTPINERLEISKEIEDTAEKERVLSGDIQLSEILETEIGVKPEPTKLSAEESLRKDAKRFGTSEEFLNFVKMILLTPDDVAAIGDKTILDMRLREFWNSAREVTAPETAAPAEVPSTAQSEKLFLDWYNTPESLEEPLARIWFASKDKQPKALSPIIWGAARRVGYGQGVTDAQWQKIRKMLENNPHKYRGLFAGLTEDVDELQLMDTQARTEVEGEVEPQAKEEQAIAHAMKSAKQAARKAYFEGKRAGTATERTRKAGLIKAKSEKKKLRAYISKLAAQIARKPGPSIDFYYREAIEALQTDIDPHFRRRSTLEARERTRQHIEQHPEAKEYIPQKVIDILNKSSLNEMSIRELEQLRDEVEILKKIGRTKRTLEQIQEQQEFNERTGTLTETVLRGEKIVEDIQPIVRSTKEKGRIKKGARFARAFTLRPSRIFDKLDRGQQFKGEFHRIFYDEVTATENQKLRAIDDRLESGQTKRKELGIGLPDLARSRIEVDGVKYTLDEALDIYAGFQNESKKLAIIYGNNIDEPTAQKIINSLTKEEKALADHIIEDYEKRYGELRKAHIAFMNKDLGHEENYTPIRRTDLDYMPLNEELKAAFLQAEHLKKSYAEKGFTISRQEILPEFQKPIRLGLYSTWIEQTAKQENYIAYAQKVLDLHRLLNDKQLAAAIKQTYGDDYFEAISHYVDRIANPTVYQALHKFERISRTLRKHTALAYLAYNLVTMGKQLPSVILYLPDAGPGHLVASTAEFAIHPFKTIEFVNSRDPQMKHRSIEREMEELKSYDRAAYDRIINKIGKAGMVGIYAMDKVATTIGWKAVYDANIKKGLSEAEAVREAQNVTLRTQPAAAPKDIAELYATREFLNWFTMFTNQLNQLYNIATHDIPQTFKQHRFYKGILQLTAMSITALSIWAISNRRLPEKLDDLKEAAKDQMINMIPLFGKLISAKDRGYGSDAPAPLEAIGDLYEVFTKTEWRKKPVQDWFTDRRFQKAANKAFEAIAVLIGLPYIGPKRIKKAIEKEDIRELIGGKPKR